MTYEEFVKKWNTEVLPKKEKYIRNGQSLINFLHEIWPEEYKRISSVHYYDEKNVDCFYVDQLMGNTFEHLERVWKNFPN